MHITNGVLGAVLTALATGLLTLIGLIVSKEQKISEFRQAWIDALRTDTALILAVAHNIEGFKTTASLDKVEHLKGLKENFLVLNGAMTRVRLRVNPKEKESQALLDALTKHSDTLNESESVTFQSLESVSRE